MEVIPFIVICFIAYGRGGIVTAIFLLVGTIFLKIVENRKKLSNWVFVEGIVLVLYVVLLVHGKRLFLYVSDNYLGKFMAYGFGNNGRAEIWTGFFENNSENLLSFLFGSNPMRVMIDGNLHNSLLQMYASFGMIFLIVNIFLIVKATLYYVRKKEKWLILIFAVVFVRSLTDMVLFRGYCEIIYYFYLFNYFINSKRVAQEYKT